MRRWYLIALLGLVVSGCGTEATRTKADTEGLYVDVGPLSYQVQISRYLNPGDTEDKAYLRGLPAGTEQPGKDAVWFGVFMRIKNYSDASQTPASDFVIKDTEGHTFQRTDPDRRVNEYAYEPTPIGASLVHARTRRPLRASTRSRASCSSSASRSTTSRTVRLSCTSARAATKRSSNSISRGPAGAHHGRPARPCPRPRPGRRAGPPPPPAAS